MVEDGTAIFIGLGGGKAQRLVLSRANRHGLIAGATGTGKTVTLQSLAEGFSRAGVPMFVADVKGDLSGMAMAGAATAKTHASAGALSEIPESPATGGRRVFCPFTTMIRTSDRGPGRSCTSVPESMELEPPGQP